MNYENNQDFDKDISEKYGIQIGAISALRGDMQTIFSLRKNREIQKTKNQFNKVIKQLENLQRTIDDFEKNIPFLGNLDTELQKKKKGLMKFKAKLENTRDNYPISPRTFKKKLVQYAIAGYNQEKGKVTKYFNDSVPKSEGTRFVFDMVKYVAPGKFRGSIRGLVYSAFKEWGKDIPKPSEITLLDGDHSVYE